MAGWIKMPLGTEVGLGPGDFVSDGDPAPPPRKWGQRPPISGPFLLWPNGWMDQDGTVMEVGLGPGHIVLDGDLAPPPAKRKTQITQFSAHVYCGQTAVCIRIPIRTEVGLDLCDIVLDGDPAPPPLKGHNPQFSSNVRCGLKAGWITMPFGMERRRLCSMGTKLPQKKKAQLPPNFGPCLLWPNGLMDQDGP